MIASLPFAVALRNNRFDNAIILDGIFHMIDRWQAGPYYFREINRRINIVVDIDGSNTAHKSDSSFFYPGTTGL